MPILNDPLIHPWSDLRNRPRRKVLVDKLLHESGISTLVAPSTWGKTTLAHAIGRTVMAGGHWDGKPVEQRNVLWSVGEDEQGLEALDAAWDRAYPGSEQCGWFREEPIDFWSLAATKALIENLKGEPPILMICDALAQHIGSFDEKEARHIQMVYNHMRMVIRANGGTILMLHHTGWDQTREKGTVAIRNNSDAMSQITKFDVRGGRVELRHSKWRGGAKLNSFAYGLRLVEVPGYSQPIPIVTGIGLARRINLDESRLSEAAILALAILVERPGPTRGEWYAVWEERQDKAGEPTSESTFDRARKELDEAGKVEKRGHGKAARFYPTEIPSPTTSPSSSHRHPYRGVTMTDDNGEGGMVVNDDDLTTIDDDDHRPAGKGNGHLSQAEMLDDALEVLHNGNTRASVS
jgi:hypothetical protein